MKKILMLVLLMSISAIGYTKEVVPGSTGGIYIVDGEEVYFCNPERCRLVSSDYTKD
jgi:hypothetical protein